MISSKKRQTGAGGGNNITILIRRVRQTIVKDSPIGEIKKLADDGNYIRCTAAAEEKEKKAICKWEWLFGCG